MALRWAMLVLPAMSVWMPRLPPRQPPPTRLRRPDQPGRDPVRRAIRPPTRFLSDRRALKPAQRLSGSHPRPIGAPIRGRIGPQPGLERPMLRPGGPRSQPPTRLVSATRRPVRDPRRRPRPAGGSPFRSACRRPSSDNASPFCRFRQVLLRQRPPEPPGVGAGAHRWRCNVLQRARVPVPPGGVVE